MNGSGRHAVPVCVVVPTIGRTELLAECLASIGACRPRPAEVLVVDQSGDGAAARALERSAIPDARVIADEGRGLSRARNIGLREARHRIVAVTDDDCVVAADWIETAYQLGSAYPGAIISGQVRAEGEGIVPSTIDDPEPHEYTGTDAMGVLFGNNMVLDPHRVLALGGFDERIKPTAEDNEFCHRWLSAGERLRYEPTLVVWHRDWRSPQELERLWIDYARGQGMFYAKHLLRRDPLVREFLKKDLRRAKRALGARARGHAPPAWTDPEQAIWRGLPVGLARGLAVFLFDRRGP